MASSRPTRSNTRRTPYSSSFQEQLAALNSDEDDSFIEIDLNPTIQDDATEVGEESVASTGSSRSKRTTPAAGLSKRGLTKPQILQLFIDVQSNGGIDQCDPAVDFYEDKKDIYGASKSGLRRQFRNKFDYWKNNEKGRLAFNQQVIESGITATLRAEKTAKAPRKKQAQRKPAAAPASVHTPSIINRSKPSTKPTPDRTSASLKVSLSSPSRPANPFQHHIETNMSNNNALSMLRLAAINQQNDRVANWEQPECNGGTILISIL